MDGGEIFFLSSEIFSPIQLGKYPLLFFLLLLLTVSIFSLTKDFKVS